METPEDRLLAYAAEMEQYAKRFRYLGSTSPDTIKPAEHAKATRAWYVQLIEDLRAVCRRSG